MISFATKTVERMVIAFPFLTRFLRMYYTNIVANEIALGKIRCDDRVLCIGGGPLPFTALEIADKTGAEVEIIDNDMYAVEAAKKLIKRLNMSDKINVVYGDGREIDTSKFSVVHVALQAKPHDSILKNVWKKSGDGTRILLRRPHDNLEMLYSELSEECACLACNYAGQGHCTVKETLLFTKGQQGREMHEKTAPCPGRAAVSSSSFLVG